MGETNVPPPTFDDQRFFADPEVYDNIKLLCHVRKTPLVLYGIFTEILKRFYSDAENLPLTACDFVWDEDNQLTKIWIGTEFDWNDSYPEMRPAIYVKLGPLKWSSLTGRHDAKMAMNLEHGEYMFSRTGSGTVSFVHVGRTSGEAVNISGATSDLLSAFAWPIKNDFHFLTLEPTQDDILQLGEEESSERYKSTVTYSYSFQDTFILKLESQKLKKILFRTGQLSC